jgi:hypothetical protein
MLKYENISFSKNSPNKLTWRRLQATAGLHWWKFCNFCTVNCRDKWSVINIFVRALLDDNSLTKREHSINEEKN